MRKVYLRWMSRQWQQFQVCTSHHIVNIMLGKTLQRPSNGVLNRIDTRNLGVLYYIPMHMSIHVHGSCLPQHFSKHIFCSLIISILPGKSIGTVWNLPQCQVKAVFSITAVQKLLKWHHLFISGTASPIWLLLPCHGASTDSPSSVQNQDINQLLLRHLVPK